MKGVKGILLMAGKGKRFDSPVPKQFALLKNKPIYLWTLEKFTSSRLFDEIILICAPEKIAEVQQAVGPTHKVVEGGSTRQESSYQGLLACGSDTGIVVIHDAVRPFVSHRILRENVEGARKYGAVDTCISSADTLVHSKDGKKIDTIPPRSEYLRGQTPQSFSYSLILKAHQKSKHSATDDCRLVLDLGHSVKVITGEEENLKVTRTIDLFFLEALMKMDLSRLEDKERE